MYVLTQKELVIGAAETKYDLDELLKTVVPIMGDVTVNKLFYVQIKEKI